MKRPLVFGLSMMMDAVLLDQVSKWLILKASPVLAGDVFFLHVGIKWVLNKHFAFSVPAPLWLIGLVVLSVLILVARRWWQEVRAGLASSYGLALVLGGALGNIIDRVRLGGVQDWIEVGIKGWSTSSFNIADVLIVVGVLLWAYLSRKREENLSSSIVS